MWSRFAPRLRKTVITALEIAAAGGQDEATDEHLLLAICRDEAAAATFMLDHAGIAPAAVAARILKHPRPAARSDKVSTRLSVSALAILSIATSEAETAGDQHVGTEHVL